MGLFSFARTIYLSEELRGLRREFRHQSGASTGKRCVRLQRSGFLLVLFPSAYRTALTYVAPLALGTRFSIFAARVLEHGRISDREQSSGGS
jgi:hypothetical protein